MPQSDASSLAADFFQAFLGGMGILSCCLSILVSVGLCSLAGLDYGPMHSLIPCLLVGLGVDDMFVIVQSYNNADREDKGESLSNVN